MAGSGRAPEGPAPRLQALVEAGRLEHDRAQKRVVTELQRCFRELNDNTGGWFRRAQRVDGVYIHGGVGRGKTLLMDLFFKSLKHAGIPAERSHFHRFMDGVHDQLREVGRKRDPLVQIANAQRKQARVLCFDEFHVEDIADAMLLGELSRQWFMHGLTLVATSNQAPAELYKDGLQRARFLPAIENLERCCRVIELDAAADYRLRELERHPTWYVPISPETDRRLAEAFDALCPDQPQQAGTLEIRGRTLDIRCRAGSLLWADFKALCDGPRSARDYIELAFRFSTLIISNIPALDDDQNNAARRFIHLIDECYDRSVKVIASSERPIETLYTGERLKAPFERTISRLVEMQSKVYLSQPHHP